MTKNEMLMDETDALNEKIREKEEKITELGGKIVSMSVEHDDMKHRLEMARKLDDLKVDEFESLMSTNMQVAENVKRLMQTMADHKSGLANIRPPSRASSLHSEKAGAPAQDENTPPINTDRSDRSATSQHSQRSRSSRQSKGPSPAEELSQ